MMHSSHATRRVTHCHPEPNPGRAGWVAVITLWTRSLMWVGILKGLGMMLPTIRDQFETTTWVMGWITSMIVVMTGFIGVLAGAVSRWFGVGTSIIVCGVLIGFGIIGASFATSVLQLACIFILPVGIGLGVSGVLVKDVVGRCFSKNYATATGIARTGYSIGLLLFAPLIQLFHDTYGWRGSMLLMGGISLHFAVSGVLMVTAGIRPANTYKPLPVDNYPSRSSIFVRVREVAKSLDMALLCDFRYWLVAIITCGGKFACDMWLIYFVSQAQSNGFSLREAATFVTVGGVCNLISKVGQGYIIDRQILPCWGLMGIAMTINATSYFASPRLTSYWAVMTTSCLILTGEGILTCLYDVLTKKVLGVNSLAGAYGWMGIKSALIGLCLGFIPGWIYDATGNYDTAFVFIGSMQLLSLVCLLFLTVVNKPWLK